MPAQAPTPTPTVDSPAVTSATFLLLPIPALYPRRYPVASIRNRPHGQLPIGATRTGSRTVVGGTVSERPKVQLSKSCVGESPPWVQIPPVPPRASPRNPCIYKGCGGFRFRHFDHLPTI